MIDTFYISNFKSLDDFYLPPSADGWMGDFTCMIGLNGAGKSTVLQAFAFIGQLPRGDLKEWLQGRGWEKNELTNLNEPKKKLITFELHVKTLVGNIIWAGVFNTTQLRCTRESIRFKDREELLLDLREGVLSVADEHGDMHIRGKHLKFEGSAMSLLDLKKEHRALAQLSGYLKNLKSLELLSPHLLRKRGRRSEDIGVGGERLSAFLDTLKDAEKASLIAEVKKLYPSFQGYEVQTKRYGWKNLKIQENEGREMVDAKHLNDGLLRIMAILSQAYSSHSFLLFDEIENGLNPEVIEPVMAFLLQMRQQVFITTHSPLILNFIPDEVALENVILIYKDNRGRTRSIRFFDLPGMMERLEFLGPGEVLIDNDLLDLIAEQVRRDEKQQSASQV